MERIEWPTVFKTCKEMMHDRGFDFKLPAETELDFNIICTSKSKEQIVIYFMNSQKININKLEDCVKDMDEKDIKNAIIIHQTGIITPKTAKILIDLKEHKYIQVFSAQSLMFNITKHFLVPPHRCLTDAESKKIIEQYGSPTKYPKILTSDPISKYYSFKRGQIIRVDRKNGPTYKYVVK